MGKKVPVGLLAMVIAVAMMALGTTPAGARPGATQAQTFTIHVDAHPHGGEPWAFLRFFPGAIEVHSGDLIHAAWASTDTPHTATFVNTDDAELWRSQNQGPGGAYEVTVPDSQLGGDDDTLDLNSSVLFPSPPDCGGQTNPCTFDGSSVISSGFVLPNPAAEPSYLVKVSAPVGTYSLLCLLHPGMEIPVDVVPTAQQIPSPQDVKAAGARQADRANRIDGRQADAQAQEVDVTTHGHGHSLWTINAGGFSDNVTANEFPDAGLTVRVGDQIKVLGNFEIHTATFPETAVDTVPFTITQCEAPGPDIPAQSPDECANPSLFQAVFNNEAVIPTASNRLRDPEEFVNSGLLVAPGTSTFVAKATGVYTMVCLVHGPEMQTTITVEN